MVRSMNVKLTSKLVATAAGGVVALVAAILVAFVLGRTSRTSAYPKDGFFKSYAVFDQTIVEMPSPAVEKAAKDGAVVLIAVSPIEEHGPHLTLGTDIYEAMFFTRGVRQDLGSRGIQAVIAPPLYWGVNNATGGFAGSFTVRPKTMQSLFEDVIASLQSWGFRRFYVISVHGDPAHIARLNEAVDSAGKRSHVSIETITVPWDAAPFPPKLQTDVHAGAFETSFMATIYPGEVNAGLARKLPTQNSFYPRGYWGSPARYTTKGVRAYLDAVVAEMTDEVVQKEKAG
jgi:creatinine amidohydrolase